MKRRPDKEPRPPASEPARPSSPDHSIGSDYGGLQGTEGEVQDEVGYGRRGAPASTPGSGDDRPGLPARDDDPSRA